MMNTYSEKKVSSIIFDLDGTLIDSVSDVHAAINYTLETLGFRQLTIEEVLPLIGRGAKYLTSGALKSSTLSVADDELIEKFYQIYIQRYREYPCDHTVVYPGVYDFLDYCAKRNITLGVCTNKPGVMTRLILQALKMDGYFESVICGDEVEYQKPDARHIEYVMEALNVKKENVMMVGDSEYDIKPANDLNVFSVLLHSQSALEQCAPNLFFDTFTQFKDYMMD